MGYYKGEALTQAQFLERALAGGVARAVTRLLVVWHGARTSESAEAWRGVVVRTVAPPTPPQRVTPRTGGAAHSHLRSPRAGYPGGTRTGGYVYYVRKDLSLDARDPEKVRARAAPPRCHAHSVGMSVLTTRPVHRVPPPPPQSNWARYMNSPARTSNPRLSANVRFGNQAELRCKRRIKAGDELLIGYGDSYGWS